MPALPRVPIAYGLIGPQIPCGLLGVQPPPRGVLVASAHCLARARALLRRQHGDTERNWLARLEPRAIVGHALYVYEIR